MAEKGSAFRRNVIWQVIGSGGQAVIGGITLIVMGRALGAHDFGIFSIVMSLVFVGNGLVELRMQDVAAKQFWDIGEDRTDHHVPYFLDLLILDVVVKLIPCLALVALTPWLTDFNNLDADYRLIPLAAVGYYLGKLGNFLAVGTLRVLGRSDLSTICLIGEQALRLVIMLTIIGTGILTPFNSLIALLAGAFLFNLLQWQMVRSQFRRVHVDLKGWRWADARARLAENRRLLFSNLGLSISDLMNKDLDVTLVSPMLSPAAVGIYKMAKNLAMLAWKIIDPVYLALMPEVNRLVALRQFDALSALIKRLSLRLLGAGVALSVGVYVGLWLFGGIVFGPAFADLPRYIWVMLLAICIAAPLVWGHPLLVALDRADAAVYGIFAASVLGIATLFLLTPSLGLYGATAGWLVTFSLTFFFTAQAGLTTLRQVRAAAASGAA